MREDARRSSSPHPMDGRRRWMTPAACEPSDDDRRAPRRRRCLERLEMVKPYFRAPCRGRARDENDRLTTCARVFAMTQRHRHDLRRQDARARRCVRRRARETRPRCDARGRAEMYAMRRIVGAREARARWMARDVETMGMRRRLIPFRRADRRRRSARRGGLVTRERHVTDEGCA